MQCNAQTTTKIHLDTIRFHGSSWTLFSSRGFTYPIRLRKITIYVIFGLSLVFYLFPRFLGESQLIEYNIIEELETFDIPETQQIRLPEPPPRPSVPVPSDDEFLDEDLTIEETDFDDFEEWDAPPPPSSGPEVTFIAYTVAPRPRTPIPTTATFSPG